MHPQFVYNLSKYLNLMNKNAFIVTGMILAVALINGCAQKTPNTPITNNSMKLTSSVFNQNDDIPAKYTCDGEDMSPPFAISEVPPKVKSLALIVDDPDAPAGDWVHWTLWNIKPETAEIAEDTVPLGATEGYTDFGKPGWGGPCPPSGIHHYQFKLYALDKVLDLPASARKADLEKAMAEHTVASTVLVGLYQKK